MCTPLTRRVRQRRQHAVPHVDAPHATRAMCVDGIVPLAPSRLQPGSVRSGSGAPVATRRFAHASTLKLDCAEPTKPSVARASSARSPTSATPASGSSTASSAQGARWRRTRTAALARDNGAAGGAPERRCAGTRRSRCDDAATSSSHGRPPRFTRAGTSASRFTDAIGGHADGAAVVARAVVAEVDADAHGGTICRMPKGPFVLEGGVERRAVRRRLAARGRSAAARRATAAAPSVAPGHASAAASLRSSTPGISMGVFGGRRRSTPADRAPGGAPA